MRRIIDVGLGSFSSFPTLISTTLKGMVHYAGLLLAPGHGFAYLKRLIFALFVIYI